MNIEQLIARIVEYKKNQKPQSTRGELTVVSDMSIREKVLYIQRHQHLIDRLPSQA